MNNLEYQRYNCIMVYNEDKTKLLFCKRTCDPYMGKYNFVGGKVNKDENEFDGAYRELFKETFNGNIEKYSILDDLLIKNNINEGMIITRKQLEELQEG